MKKTICAILIGVFFSGIACAATLKFRRDSAADWTSNNPTLAEGELGFETDTDRFKIGNGSTDWISLGYKTPTIIAKNTATINATTLNDASIDANACAYQVVSVPATGVLSTDVPIVTPNASIRNVTSYGVTTAGSLRIDVYPSAGYVNFEVCNPTGAAIVPGEIILNFMVIR